MNEKRNGRFHRTGAKLAALIRHEGGLSALEFALIGPFLVVGFLTMIDVGFAAYQRMTMDNVLRAGAQSAMEDPGIERVLNVLQIAAEGNSPGTFTVDRYCSCPGNASVKVACSTICPGTVPTRAYYSLSVYKVYSGMLIPDISFKPEIQVQVR